MRWRYLEQERRANFTNVQKRHYFGILALHIVSINARNELLLVLRGLSRCITVTIPSEAIAICSSGSGFRLQLDIFLFNRVLLVSPSLTAH